jgi:hypothetical protein
MKRTATSVVVLAALALVASTASAQNQIHYNQQRQAAIGRQAFAHQHLNHGHQGGHTVVSNLGVQSNYRGPQINSRFPTHGSGGYGGYGACGGIQQNIQYYPVVPYGYGYGVPAYGYGSYSNYAAPYIGGGTGIYIHRELYFGR